MLNGLIGNYKHTHFVWIKVEQWGNWKQRGRTCELNEQTKPKSLCACGVLNARTRSVLTQRTVGVFRPIPIWPENFKLFIKLRKSFVIDPDMRALRRREATMSGNNEPHITTRMKEVWLNEKNSPEILPYEGELVSTLLAQIETQVCYLLYKINHTHAHCHCIYHAYNINALTSMNALSLYFSNNILVRV